MRRLLLINPNTSQSISALIASHAERQVGPDVMISMRTARFGAPYIACETSYAVAGHAVLDAWACALADGAEPFHSVLIACFGDPALFALRESSKLPVTGLAEASFMAASAIGRFAIVTGGERWKPMLERLVHSLGFAAHLAGIHTVAPSGAQLATDPAAAQKLLAQTCIDAARMFDAEVVILGGAGLAGMAAAIQPQVPVPVIDSMVAGVQHALDQAQQETLQPRKVFEFKWCNVSREIEDLS